MGQACPVAANTTETAHKNGLTKISREIFGKLVIVKIITKI